MTIPPFVHSIIECLAPFPERIGKCAQRQKLQAKCWAHLGELPLSLSPKALLSLDLDLETWS